MTEIKEGNLKLTFGPSWKVLKYDANGSFYKTLMENKMKPTKAVDFLCFDAISSNSACSLLFLEAKDFSLAVPRRTKFDAIPNVVALKARDTVAGIVGGALRANDAERSFLQKARRLLSEEPRVMYLFEDLIPPTRRPPARSANNRDVLQKQLREHLRWLTRSVAVIGLNDYKNFIPDLTIQRI